MITEQSRGHRAENGAIAAHRRAQCDIRLYADVTNVSQPIIGHNTILGLDWIEVKIGWRLTGNDAKFAT
jgi:hypothetical protein